MLNNTLRWTLSFLFFTWRKVNFAKCTLRFGPKDMVLRKIDLDFGGDCFEFFQKASRYFSTTCLRLLAGLTVNLFVPENALFAEFSSRLCFVLVTYGRMPTIT